MTDATPLSVVQLAESILEKGRRAATSVSVDDTLALAHAVCEGAHYLHWLDQAEEAHNTCSALIATTQLTLKSVEGEASDALVTASQGLEKLNSVFLRFRNYKEMSDELPI